MGPDEPQPVSRVYLTMWLLLACTDADPKDSNPNSTDTTPTDTGPTDTGGTTQNLTKRILVSAYVSGAVYLYDRGSGERVGVFADVPGAQTAVLAPDGTLTICAEEVDEVRSYALDGTLLGVLASVLTPTAAIWGPDGDLFVAVFDEDRVAHYDPLGTWIEDIVSAGAGGLDGPDIGMRFGPDGNLYVPGWYSNAIHAFAPDGTPLPDVMNAAEHGVQNGRGLAFSEDGRLFATAQGSNQILTWDGTSVTEFASVQSPAGIAVDGDEVLVASEFTETVKVYDLATGEGQGGLVSDEEIVAITAVTVIEAAWE